MTRFPDIRIAAGMSLSFLPEKFQDRGIGDYVASLTEFLANFSWIYDFKLTRFLRDGVYERIPDEWKQTLISLSNRELNELPYAYGSVKEEWPPSLRDFVSEAISLLIQGNDVRKSLGRETESVVLSGRIVRGMKPKKRHEVERMVAFVGQLCGEREIRHVVDVGAGLGYVGQALSCQFGLKVLGLESVETRCHAANQRQEKLLSGSGIATRMDTINFTMSDSQENVGKFSDILRDFCGIGGKGLQPVCLLGLHCCGDLTPLMLRRFSECCPPRSVLVCMGCCYHRMSTDGDKFCFFPLSAGVKRVVDDMKKCPDWKLNAFGLRLAAQETRARWREQSVADHHLHMKRVAFRAVLETVLEPEDRARLQKVVKDEECATFQSYISAALNHLDTSSEIHEKLKKMCRIAYSQFEQHFQFVEPFTALQVLLQPLLESLIISDQVLYLTETGISSHVVAMFDDLISPRNLAIVATKP